MSHESFGVCPYCKRKLEKSERYCWFCEQDISDARDKEEKSKRKKKK